MNTSFSVSTPGRICLFGEHLDYLGLPVMAAAISRRVQLTATPISQPTVRLNLPDLGTQETFSLAELPIPYTHDRDYFRSAVNVLVREGFRFSRGIEGEVRGTIPINAGTSSSSALLITWLNVLSQLADEPQTLPATRLAELAYVAEVLEFGEPGGMMDHYATAVGGIIYLESQPAIRLETYRPPLGTFVLGDSAEPKDTIGILSRVKGGMRRITRQLTAYDPAFSLHTTPADALPDYRTQLRPDEYTLLQGTFANRAILQQAVALFRAANVPGAAFDDHQFGHLLNEHQTNLRNAQQISTPKIDRMLDAALQAGALGGKINGSGGGGCMFVYAPQQPQRVAEAIEREGGRAHIITVDEGTRQVVSPEQRPM